MHLKVTVVLEHMFHPSEMEEEATLREDLQDDIKTECVKMGPVEKVQFSSISVLLSAMASNMWLLHVNKINNHI